ncbi:DUF1003 domain-containing protein [Paenibacillus monticola]|uniref:DUF1003 domain-containing protein n=1 Tax=Paenibacillus monticola TaxID=2666075 RepID=A0A7X2L5B0_9BACL|nr:DUF1003 domain-containing protein [Paenibacillus monticola]MRN56301.1 DUF1003 domain-containing protein [Paenibacillus monticola]
MKDEQNVVEDLNVAPGKKLSEVHIRRVTKMVKEYKGDIEAHLDEEQAKGTSWSGRLADNIASFGGSWPFIIIFISFLLLWMVWNIIGFTVHFDKSPFILLNLILSCLAALQAPVILMSQNRQAARDKQESIMDFAINFKAEQENLAIQKLLHKIDHRLAEIENKLDAQAGTNSSSNSPS